MLWDKISWRLRNQILTKESGFWVVDWLANCFWINPCLAVLMQFNCLFNKGAIMFLFHFNFFFLKCSESYYCIFFLSLQMFVLKIITKSLAYICRAFLELFWGQLLHPIYLVLWVLGKNVFARSFWRWHYFRRCKQANAPFSKKCVPKNPSMPPMSRTVPDLLIPSCIQTQLLQSSC